MIDSTEARGIPTTTTLTLARGDVVLTLAGIPATRRSHDDQAFIDGPLAEHIDDAARALLDIVDVAARGRIEDGESMRADASSLAQGGASVESVGAVGDGIVQYGMAEVVIGPGETATPIIRGIRTVIEPAEHQAPIEDDY